MTDFRTGAVARVPFPYTDRSTRQYRPALVIATGLGPERDKLWVAMITSAENRRWAGDVSLNEDYRAAGLPGPSVIRTEKITTIDASAAEWRGDLPPARLAEVEALVAMHLGLERG